MTLERIINEGINNTEKFKERVSQLAFDTKIETKKKVRLIKAAMAELASIYSATDMIKLLRNMGDESVKNMQTVLPIHNSFINPLRYKMLTPEQKTRFQNHEVKVLTMINDPKSKGQSKVSSTFNFIALDNGSTRVVDFL